MRIYLDSLIFIYAVEGTEELGSISRSILDCLQRSPGTLVTSEISLAEVLAPTRQRDTTPPALEGAFVDLMTDDRWIELRPVTRSIVLATAAIRSKLGQKLIDAIHIATAEQAECAWFVSNDARLRLPEGLMKIEPDEKGLEKLRAVL